MLKKVLRLFVTALACGGCSHAHVVQSGAHTPPLDLQVEPLRNRKVTISVAWLPERVDLDTDGHSYEIQGVRAYVANAVTGMIQGHCESAKLGDEGGYFVFVPTVKLEMYTNGVANHVCTATTKVAIRNAQGRKVAAGGSSETVFFAAMPEGGMACEAVLVKSTTAATRKSLEDLNRSGAGLLSTGEHDR